MSNFINFILDLIFGKYKCPVDGKRFKTISALSEHVKINHIEQRPEIDINWS